MYCSSPLNAAFMRLPFALLPSFGDGVQRQTQNRNSNADAHDGKSGIFENRLRNRKNKFNNLNDRINDDTKNNCTHRRSISI